VTALPIPGLDLSAAYWVDPDYVWLAESIPANRGFGLRCPVCRALQPVWSKTVSLEDRTPDGHALAVQFPLCGHLVYAEAGSLAPSPGDRLVRCLWSPDSTRHLLDVYARPDGTRYRAAAVAGHPSPTARVEPLAIPGPRAPHSRTYARLAGC
jgi:hypothetical protein